MKKEERKLDWILCQQMFLKMIFLLFLSSSFSLSFSPSFYSLFSSAMIQKWFEIKRLKKGRVAKEGKRSNFIKYLWNYFFLWLLQLSRFWVSWVKNIFCFSLSFFRYFLRKRERERERKGRKGKERRKRRECSSGQLTFSTYSFPCFEFVPWVSSHKISLKEILSPLFSSLFLSFFKGVICMKYIFNLRETREARNHKTSSFHISYFIKNDTYEWLLSLFLIIPLFSFTFLSLSSYSPSFLFFLSYFCLFHFIPFF